MSEFLQGEKIMSAVKVALQHSSKSGRRKTSKTMSADVSPDSKCPICLDVFHNMSYLDRCLHKFCFRCILEWSKNKPECPLCKQPFSSIYHSIKSDEDFQKYELKQQVENSSFGYFEGVRFRYRTTLTGVHQQMRRTSLPPDNGVMFEASSDLPQQRRDRYIRRMMMRLAAKRRAASEGRAVNNVREQEMINFRRELYRRGVRVRNVRDGGRSRDTSAEFYRRNPACLHRLVPWLKRELMVLYGAHGSLVNIVQHIIMSRIARYDMEDGAIQEELRPFLQGRTEHFLHEFINFAKSPFNLEAYDQHAVYDCPAPSSNEHSSSNSSVIAISEDEENSAEMEPPGNSASTLSQSLWDDETPGPSYSTTTEPSRQDFQTVLDLDSESSSEDEQQMFGASPPQISSYSQTDVAHADGTNEDCASSDGDDCVIVGYVKPTTERTPELVHLSSDSDGSSVEENQEAPLQSQHIRFTSCSPANSHSSDSSKAGETPKGQTDHHHQSSSKERLGSNTYNTSSGRRTHKRFDSRERSIEGHKSKERDHKRKKSHSKSRGRKYSSKSPVISQSTFSSHARRGNFSKTDGLHARRDSDHSYQSYTHYRRERNGSVSHYTQRRSYYYSSHKYSHSKSRSRSRDSPHRRDGRRSRSRAFSSSCSSSPERKSHHDKPGGKRKYKAKHLAEPSKNTQSGQSDSMSLTKHKKTSKEKHHKRSKERSRRRSRSGSTEVVGERHKHHHKKKKHKKKSKKSKSSEHKAKSSPNVITIESDNESFANRSITPVSRTAEHTFIDNAADGGENPATVDQASQSH
ncbi:topoisomerase I binding, arginine/serine-rich a isoform X1 [Poecilia formosa]|uniref:E3 ubiquitin-protein ligase Topors n=2 Tax=Poecilia formosa TaxID=48698 RepID=A0A087Y1R5_POEFO|nr:PREDICTED: E3 ubiquitin-protein ligase Topors isoform X1 [Poecilia formosa]